MNKKKKAGQPPKYTEAEVMQVKIDAFFDNCDEEGIHYTVTGLAMALDMDRHSIVNYGKKEEFFTTVKRARLRIENYVEQRLFENNVTGSIFNLKNNFGWVDKTELKADIQGDVKYVIKKTKRKERPDEIQDKEPSYEH